MHDTNRNGPTDQKNHFADKPVYLVAESRLKMYSITNNILSKTDKRLSVIPGASRDQAQLFSFEVVEVIPEEMKTENTKIRILQKANGQAWAIEDLVVYQIM